MNAIGVALALLLGAAISARALRWRMFVVTVRGLSMTPALQPGDRLLVHRSRRRSYAVNQIVILRNPDIRALQSAPTTVEQPELLAKRIVAVSSAGLDVRGDNAWVSRDSRHWGLVPYEVVVGVVRRPLRTSGWHGVSAGPGVAG